jgi:hypothetical protein
MAEGAKVRPHQHPRHHAIPIGFGEGHAFQLRKRHFHRIDFFKRRHGRQSLRFRQPSYAGPAYPSNFIKALFVKMMVCRVKPGNDVSSNRHGDNGQRSNRRDQSPLILQPGPAALTDGLDAIVAALWADSSSLR